MAGVWDFPSAFFAMGIVLIICAIGMFFVFGFYIMRSIALYTLAKNRGMSGAGFAWIPIIGVYRIGAIADDIAEKNGSRTYYRHFMLAGTFLTGVFTGASGASATSWSEMGRFMNFAGFGAISWLIPIAMLIITAISLNTIYKCYRPGSATAWTVLSVIFSFLQAIFLFILRNNRPLWGEPGHVGYYPPYPPGGSYWQAPFPPQGTGYEPPQAPNPPSWDDRPPNSGA